MLRAGAASIRARARAVEAGKDGGGATLRFGAEEFRLGWEKSAGRNREDRRALRENLLALVREAQEAGTELVLMTYPSRMWNYGEAGDLIREIARAEGVRLVDLAAASIRSARRSRARGPAETIP